MFKLIYLLPIKPNFNFLKLRFVAFALSAILMVSSIAVTLTKGINWGIDFSGGISMDIKSKDKAVDIKFLRKNLAKFKPEIQSIGHEGNIFDIRLPVQEEGTSKETVKNIKSVLGNKVEYRNVEIVGPKVGAELINKGILAVVLSLLAMSFYIWMRFDMAFSIGAIAALIHDIIATIGLFALFQIDFSLASIAAILTIAGYSINDTVVSYDKMRENLGKHKKKSVYELINLSINETFSRTILTSLTTLVAVSCIFVFGGEVLKGFSSAMLFGVLIGTYSSVFIAMPMLNYLQRFFVHSASK